MSTRYYPLWQRGNPQLRVFLPNFWMKLIKPAEPTPPNVIKFITSIEMTHHDVRNYLEKIYKIPVVDVKVEVKQGEFRKCPEKQHLIKDEDFKEATVTLRKGVRFEFPNVTDSSVQREKAKKKREQLRELKKTQENLTPSNPHRPFLPTWFSQ